MQRCHARTTLLGENFMLASLRVVGYSSWRNQSSIIYLFTYLFVDPQTYFRSCIIYICNESKTMVTKSQTDQGRSMPAKTLRELDIARHCNECTLMYEFGTEQLMALLLEKICLVVDKRNLVSAGGFDSSEE